MEDHPSITLRFRRSIELGWARAGVRLGLGLGYGVARAGVRLGDGCGVGPTGVTQCSGLKCARPQLVLRSIGWCIGSGCSSSCRSQKLVASTTLSMAIGGHRHEGGVDDHHKCELGS